MDRVDAFLYSIIIKEHLLTPFGSIRLGCYGKTFVLCFVVIKISVLYHKIRLTVTAAAS